MFEARKEAGRSLRARTLNTHHNGLDFFPCADNLVIAAHNILASLTFAAGYQIPHGGIKMSLTATNRSLELLHPNMRDRVQKVLLEIETKGLPLKVFEAWRSPSRQRYLYAQGRTRPGKIVTYAEAWESYHQYGLAVDLVGHVDGKWTWDLPDSTWKQMHSIGAKYGLERLGFETPHLQLSDLKIGDLMEGNWPDGGDDTWYNNMVSAIEHWDGSPPAPPVRTDQSTRPPIIDLIGANGLDWSSTPAPSSAGWHSIYNGQEWRHDNLGVYLKSSPNKPFRSPGAPTTCTKIIDLYGSQIYKSSMDYGIPPEIIVMTIAVETAFAKNSDFTGPKTFRWEPHVKVKDVLNPTFGDYSAGPMQTLATTARDVIRRENLPYPDPFAVAPYYDAKPAQPPKQNPLYNGKENIDIGTAEIKTRTGKTNLDPILVAAAYNAGGLYQTSQNPWHLRSSNDHLDRAAQWYGDSCFIFSAFR